MSEMLWEVYALKYADRNNRKRVESFILDPLHDQPHAMDYFIWVLKSGDQVILVDTGYDPVEAKRRGRAILRPPVKALEAVGVMPDEVKDVIVTHLHYDHAGCLADFPNATLHIHPTELAYATGPCMCEDALRAPFTGAHICDAITALYSGRVRFTGESDYVADGVTVHPKHTGGHCVWRQTPPITMRISCAASRFRLLWMSKRCWRALSGWMCLASDAAHYYENFLRRKPFPIVVDVEEMLAGFDP